MLLLRLPLKPHTPPLRRRLRLRPIRKALVRLPVRHPLARGGGFGIRGVGVSFSAVEGVFVGGHAGPFVEEFVVEVGDLGCYWAGLRCLCVCWLSGGGWA